uniref:Isocitrate dehydrogenase (NADP(+)) n=1 Tax=Vannella robusta TaxID=1487602 RepID=A0A7S4IAV6_9EUKA
MAQPSILYTKTDEAPALATYSFLPVIKRFTASSGINVELRDISLAGRILSQFPDALTDEQRVSDELANLGALTQLPEANIIKLPNISASTPQLKACVKELQQKGYKIPDYVDEPKTDAEKEARTRYDRVKGSAVNPVLREGNSDRRAPPAVKAYAKQNPHRMGKWSSDSKTNVGTMKANDFFSNEKSLTLSAATTARIEHVSEDGTVKVLKASLPLLEGEILDGTFMSKKALLAFLEEQISFCKEQGILFSLHMKATMMKVSDPIIFGHTVRVFFKDLIANHGDLLDKLSVDFNHGFGDLSQHLKESSSSLSEEEKKTLQSAIDATFDSRPDLAMVDSDKGITNLHVPSDVIIDASMPAMIRTSGQMWNKEGKQQDTLAVIPDSSYSGVYQAVLDFCRTNGAFDPKTMGTCPNVGLMAKKAEEYGSHDKTFQVHANGTIRIVDSNDKVLLSHDVEEGDIWRACQTKDAPVRDWVKLAVSRARATNVPALFWLDEKRAHDAEIISKVNAYLPEHDTNGLDIRILDPVSATKETLTRMKAGEDTISVSGNVLRDYLTDLFPILEVGTSAKMLSIVPLMAGGGLFETGAGGSAPKHVQQFNEENYLRWDSLGEFLALAVSLNHLGEKFNNSKARLLGKTLDEATTQYLLNDKSPTRKLGGIDNRGSHFYLALYWAQSLVAQKEDEVVSKEFAPLADKLSENEEKIVSELIAVQGSPCDIGGYYLPDEDKAFAAMRPSSTFTSVIDSPASSI